MASSTFFRLAARSVRPASVARGVSYVRPSLPTRVASPSAFVAANNFSISSKLRSGHEEETFEEFSARYEKEFDAVQDVFELQRNLNNAFAYDLVPSVEVVSAALRAARRVNDFPTAVRIFEGVRAKVENEGQYKQYLEQLENLRTELGISLREELYPKNE
ncbi:putative cytochrome c oxidase subunit VA [Talaromyces proteolyticus]|uniref:Cytochrome c oxidase subunit 6, mitochondrial n=1 Tax=Talaromyces proteolyticus TaxID=1131652 RepID=A0AAD4Q3N4_9EURO|nr:putative cytochrome c oxidase subunit VA [Talaromyces proteolyticus]KAH8701963.1 putative cytochrome c oxidase subunit VA [Talaromyces proteolyticus]